MNVRQALASVAATTLPLLPVTSSAAVLTFEDLSDGDTVAMHYLGLSFTNAKAITAGISLNEFEFPPHSGVLVVFDAGVISIAFDTPILLFEAYFTYAVPLTLSAFGSGMVPLGSVTSGFGSNLVLSGDIGSTPNELLSISSAVSIFIIEISGDPGGFSFVMDDLSYTPIQQVPEPSSIVLTLTALGLLTARHRKAML